MDVKYGHALNLISRKGCSEAQPKECLEEYASLNMWQIHPSTFDIHFKHLWVLDSVSGEVKIDGSEVELVLQTLASISSSLPSCKLH